MKKPSIGAARERSKRSAGVPHQRKTEARIRPSSKSTLHGPDANQGAALGYCINGCPQFSNDDVVIPGLVAGGYEIEDARDYSVAACWEFIIPGRGKEVVNIGAVSMPSAVDLAIREGLAAGESFEGILDRVQFHLVEQVKRLAEQSRKLFLPPAPYYSVLMDGCLENGCDLSAGLKYNNFGIHGAASGSAADALAAVKEFVYDKESVEPMRLLRALEDNFANDEELRLRLREKAPKVGNNDDRADQWLVP